MQPQCGLIVKSLETEVRIRKRGGEANILCAGCGFQRGDRTSLSWVEEGVNYPCPPQLTQGWCFQRGNRASRLPGWRGRQLLLSTTTYTKFMFSEGRQGMFTPKLKRASIILVLQKCTKLVFTEGHQNLNSRFEEGVNYPCPPQLARSWCFRGQSKYFSYW